MSAGRRGGYFHIDWNGDITPCAFVPYSTDNIHDIYARGGDMNSALESPLFKMIRDWQDRYGFAQPADRVDNWLCPCVMRDHFGVLRDAVLRSGARPVNAEAAAAMRDPDYCSRMVKYGEDIRRMTNPIWDEEYAPAGVAGPGSVAGHAGRG